MKKTFSGVCTKILSAALAAALLAASAGCSKNLKSTKEELTAVASIDEFEVPYEQVRYFVRNYMREEAAGDEAYWTPEKADERAEDLYTDTFDALRNQYAVFSLCKKYGVDRDNEAITELVNGKIDSCIEEYGGEENYAAVLAENYMTDSVYRFFTRVSVCEEELYYAMMEAGALETDDKVLEKKVRGDEFIRVKQILIASDNGRSAEENRAAAEEARRLALAGEDFDALVSKYGEDLYMFGNTDGYYICRGVWYRAFEDAAFALPVGGISDVIETSAGYSVLMRCQKEEAYLTANMTDLCGDWRDAQFSLAIEERAAEMTVTRREAFSDYSPLTMKMKDEK